MACTKRFAWLGDGQAPLIAAVSGKSPERVLAWSDPETFILRRDHKVESAGYKIVIAELSPRGGGI